MNFLVASTEYEPSPNGNICMLYIMCKSAYMQMCKCLNYSIFIKENPNIRTSAYLHIFLYIYLL
jgi:hypothetical protein